jgi:hypothetical protein
MNDDQLPQRAIVGFHQDEEGHWVADLECGHTQHMRHQPPWQNREWVLTPDGRARFIGVRIECRRCSLEDDNREGREDCEGREGE